jgi:hypothetical protein
LGKTECILFGSKRKLKKADKFQVIGTCNEHIITAQSSVKYLGTVWKTIFFKHSPK